MMMMSCKMIVLLLVVCVQSSYAQNSYFCDNPIAAAASYISTNGGMTGSTLVASGPGSLDDLVHLDASEQLVSRTMTQNAVTFPNGHPETDASFCNGGKMFSARISTDNYDDLLCHESNGEFTYKIYRPSANSYGQKMDLPAIAGWSCAAGSQVIIGNFDGKGTDEIICVGAAATTFNLALMYSPPDCLVTDRYRPQARRLHRHYGRGRGHGRGKRHARNYRCRIGQLYVLQSGSVPNCNPSTDSVVVGKVGSKYADGLICHKNSDNSVSYYVGGALKTTLFNSEVAATGAGVTCVRSADEMISADVNGDGYSDLVCVSKLADPYKLKISTQNSMGGAFTAFAASGCTPGTNGCYEATNTNPISWDVGSFNGDGKEDLFCRFDNSAGTDEILHIVTA